MSKRSRRRPKRSASQIIFWAMSALLASSMVISLIVVALQPAPATATPFPTWTPFLLPTSTPAPIEPEPTSEARPSPTIEPTQPLVGPQLPTASPTITPTITPTASPTITPTITPTPSSASEPLIFAVAGDSRDRPRVYGQVLEAVAADGSQFLVHTGDLVNRGTEAQWQGFEEIMTGFPLPFTPCRETTIA